MKRNSSKNAENSAKKHSGFTLVELVVVIAVLAILAGVGAVAYRGYIKHAKEAADLELLSAVNTAFQASCMDEGMKTYPAIDAGASANLDVNMKVDTVYALKNNEITPTFRKYYKGNDEKAFQVYKKLIYVGGGRFSGATEGSIKEVGNYEYSVVDDGNGNKVFNFTNKEDGKNLTYTVSTEGLNSFAKSTFGTDMKMSDLLEDVDKATGIFGRLFYKSITKNNEEIKAIADRYGIEHPGYETQDFYDHLGNAGIVLLAEKTSEDDYKNSAQAKVDGWINGEKAFSSATDLGIDYLGYAIHGLTAEEMANASMAFALATSYANSDYASDKMIDGKTTKAYYNDMVNEILKGGTQSIGAGAGAVTKLLDGIFNNNDFKTYYSSSDQLTSDLNGYLSAMEFIEQNEDSIMSGNDALNKGFGATNNSDLGDILDSIFQ